MSFTPLQTLLGALLLLQSTTTLLLSTGRALGASSLLGTLPAGPTLANAPIIAGMALATRLAARWAPWALPDTAPVVPTHMYLLGAALVGAGSRAANGCASGHLLCGVPRGSPRSLVASAVFFCAAAATATLLRAPVPAPAPAPGAGGVAPGVVGGLLAATTVGCLAVLVVLPGGELARAVAGLWCGGVFALGLGVSGMAGGAKPLGFLTMRAGVWDPSLAMVLVGAVAPAAAGLWRYGMRVCRRPVLGGVWAAGGEGRRVDARLVGGSVLFGVGWGLAGVCPGTAVVALAARGGGVAAAWVLVFWAGWWGVGVVL